MSQVVLIVSLASSAFVTFVVNAQSTRFLAVAVLCFLALLHSTASPCFVSSSQAPGPVPPAESQGISLWTSTYSGSLDNTFGSFARSSSLSTASSATDHHRRANDVLFFTSQTPNQLVAVNLTTGEQTIIGSFNEAAPFHTVSWLYNETFAEEGKNKNSDYRNTKNNKNNNEMISLAIYVRGMYIIAQSSIDGSVLLNCTSPVVAQLAAVTPSSLSNAPQLEVLDDILIVASNQTLCAYNLYSIIATTAGRSCPAPLWLRNDTAQENLGISIANVPLVDTTNKHVLVILYSEVTFMTLLSCHSVVSGELIFNKNFIAMVPAGASSGQPSVGARIFDSKLFIYGYFVQTLSYEIRVFDIVRGDVLATAALPNPPGAEKASTAVTWVFDEKNKLLITVEKSCYNWNLYFRVARNVSDLPRFSVVWNRTALGSGYFGGMFFDEGIVSYNFNNTYPASENILLFGYDDGFTNGFVARRSEDGQQVALFEEQSSFGYWGGTFIESLGMTTAFTVDEAGTQTTILAVAPCFLYTNASCPASCLYQYGACGPQIASKSICQSDYGMPWYQWCPTLGSCVNRSSSSSSALPTNPACPSCSVFSKTECPPNGLSVCAWCENLGLCQSTTENEQCECNILNSHDCTASSPSACTWCDAQQYCADRRQVLNVDPHRFCECENFPSAVCFRIERHSGLCQVQQQVAIGISDPRSYCTSALVCESPLTCEGLNTAPQAQFACQAAGCDWNGVCSGSSCFNFFLPSFIGQPFVLLFLGFFKDVCVLLLIGAFGDVVGRVVKKRLIGIQFWWNKWDKERIKVNLDETVYLMDPKCRNDGPANDVYSADFSFERYCYFVVENLFELQLEGDDHGEEDDEEDDGQTRQEGVRTKTQCLFDAVAFSLFDSGLWIELPNAASSSAATAAAATSSASLKPTSHNQFDERREELEQQPSSRHVVHDEDNSPREVVPVSNLLIQEEVDVNNSGNKINNKKNIIKLSMSSFVSNVVLQSIVDKAIAERATSVVFYAHSRDLKTRVASSLNTFPSAPQLLLYCAGIFFMFVTAFYDVFLKETNRKTVQRIANAGCSANATNFLTNYSSDATTSTNSNNSNSNNTLSLEVAVYLLLGFRLMNATTFSTSMLVFVKVIRGLYQHFSRGFDQLTLSQRLPLIAFFSKRSIHVLLSFYFALVFPFCWIGPTYGWIVGLVCGIPFLLCLCGMVADAAILFLVRKFLGSSSAATSSSSVAEVVVSEMTSDLDYSSATDIDNSKQKNRTNDDPPTLSNKENADEEETAPTLARLFDVERHRRRLSWQQKLLSNLTTSGDETPEIENTSSLSSSSPRDFFKALIVFLLTEEIPTILLTVSLQVSFNYVAYLHYSSTFGVDTANIVSHDYSSRKLECVEQVIKNDISGVVSLMTSFTAFF